MFLTFQCANLLLFLLTLDNYPHEINIRYCIYVVIATHFQFIEVTNDVQR